MAYVSGMNEPAPDMAFRDDQSRRLWVDSSIPAERIDAWFSHHIVRQPEDLLAHVQRVHFATSQNAEPALYSALLDLFIALGSRGQALRETLLAQSSELLSDVHRVFLQASISAGINARDSIEDPAMSMLCRGFSGVGDLIEASKAAPAEDMDPLRQALESIECSELDEARAILEKSFFGGTFDAVQQQLLLEIYRKTDDSVHFEKLYATFSPDLAPDDWLVLAEHFSVES